MWPEKLIFFSEASSKSVDKSLSPGIRVTNAILEMPSFKTCVDPFLSSSNSNKDIVEE